MKTIEEQFQKLGVVPVVVLEDKKDAIPLAKALSEGGLPCAEVTFRTDAAAESIRLISETYPDMLVGAGTVLTTEQVDLAVKSGAKFIVSPGFDPEIVDYCLIKAMAAPYQNLKFMPTGGINTGNLKDYLSCDKILCCGGSWMVKGDMIRNGEFDQIQVMVKEAKKLADEIRFN